MDLVVVVLILAALAALFLGLNRRRAAKSDTLNSSSQSEPRAAASSNESMPIEERAAFLWRVANEYLERQLFEEANAAFQAIDQQNLTVPGVRPHEVGVRTAVAEIRLGDVETGHKRLLELAQNGASETTEQPSFLHALAESLLRQQRFSEAEKVLAAIPHDAASSKVSVFLRVAAKAGLDHWDSADRLLDQWLNHHPAQLPETARVRAALVWGKAFQSGLPLPKHDLADSEADAYDVLAALAQWHQNEEPSTPPELERSDPWFAMADALRRHTEVDDDESEPSSDRLAQWTPLRALLLQLGLHVSAPIELDGLAKSEESQLIRGLGAQPEQSSESDDDAVPQTRPLKRETDASELKPLVEAVLAELSFKPMTMLYREEALGALDGVGFDVVARHDETGEATMVKYRRWAGGRVGDIVFRQLESEMKSYNLHKGMLITDATLTETARTYVAGKDALSAVDGETFQRFIGKVMAQDPLAESA